MTEPKRETPAAEEERVPTDAELEAQERALGSLIASERARAAPPPSLLPEVQRRLRRRSKGKFYADGWSVEAGRINYVLVAVAMLLVLAVAYFALGPTSFSH